MPRDIIVVDLETTGLHKPRDIIVVDLETTGLHKGSTVLEVAAVNLKTGKELSFVPYVDPKEWQSLNPQALMVNRYFERGVWKQKIGKTETESKWNTLRAWLSGNTFAGSNPTFDAERIPWGPCWHHRLLDLSAYAAGVLGIDPGELPGLHAVCERLEVVNEEEHSALADARATAECFRRLKERRSTMLSLTRPLTWTTAPNAGEF